MIHTIIVQDPSVFRLITEQNDTKRVPLADLPYEMHLQGNIRIVGGYDMPIGEVLASVVCELNPDTVFFLSESYPVSDEKLAGDIVLPNALFSYDPNIESEETGENAVDLALSHPLFLEHYPMQGDYDFESFGLSVGGIHVSGEWNTEMEDFRIRLRIAYENDTFDSFIYPFVEAAQKQGMQEKAYPVAYIGTEDPATTARNLWSIVRFIIGSIDSEDPVSVEEEQQDDDGDWE